MIRMKQKPLAIVSGGGGYVGSAIRATLERSGWDVVSLGIRASDDDRVYECDVTNEQQVEDIIKKITRQYGQVCACIHAAAMPIDNRPLLEIDIESFEMSIKIAVRGAFLLAKFVVPHMKAGSAFIGVTTKLIEPEATLPPTGSHITAKYALRGFLRTLASEMQRKHIRVYAVAPGFLPGGLNRGVSLAMIDFLATKSGIGSASVEAVADLVRTLCSEKEAYPSGSSISLPPLRSTKL